MPRLPYLTYIDAFFLECYIYVFLAVVELMTVHVTHRSQRRRDLGLRIRRYCAMGDPSVVRGNQRNNRSALPGVTAARRGSHPEDAEAGMLRNRRVHGAAIPSASAARVSTGSSTPSSHSRALE